MVAPDVYLEDVTVETAKFNGGTVERLDPERTEFQTFHIHFNDSMLPEPGMDLDLLRQLNGGQNEIGVVSQREGLVSVYADREAEVPIHAVSKAAETTATTEIDALHNARFGELSTRMWEKYVMPSYCRND